MIFKRILWNAVRDHCYSYQGTISIKEGVKALASIYGRILNNTQREIPKLQEPQDISRETVRDFLVRPGCHQPDRICINLHGTGGLAWGSSHPPEILFVVLEELQVWGRA